MGGNPLLLDDNEAKAVKIANPEHDPSAAFDEGEDGNPAGEGKDEEAKEPPFFQVDRLEFVFQMVWQEQPLAERVAKKDAERAAAAEAAAAEKKLQEEQAAQDAANGS